jgi:acylphosphatase
MSDKKSSVRIVVAGAVQGVFFRRFAKENALRLGLSGYVRNLANGNVEIVVEGTAEAVERMIALCRKGPERAHVKSVAVEVVPYQSFKSFEIM